jgi:hypothetical protein
MTTLDPFDLDPDDERLSRYLDGDLTGEERAALEHDLAGDPELASRLAAMRTIAAWLALAPEPAELTGVDHVVQRALHAYDEAPLARATAERERSDDAADGPVAPVVPLRARGWWARPQLWSAAAAVAVLAAVATFAVRSGDDDDRSAETAAVAERNTARQAEHDAGSAQDGGQAADAALFGATTAVAGSLGSPVPQAAPAAASDRAADVVARRDYPDLDTFFAATSSALAGPSSEEAATVSTTAATSPAGIAPVESSTLPPASMPPFSAPSTADSCVAIYPHIATIGGEAVRWRVRGAGTAIDPVTIDVVDAQRCELLGSRPA